MIPTALLLALDILLALGLTARLTRAIVAEDIGGRFLRWPAEKWVQRGDFHSWRRWWADALSCPWCVSTWIGILAALALMIAQLADPLLIAYRIIAGGLTLSFIAAWLTSASAPEEDDPVEAAE